ncbi:Flp family type IVb pilin [Vibrio splendidus]|uniref:Flp family type IVb pilin n=1 Tax=Vibrio TaxID=662 RepID=UPI000C8583DF|nr:MULTISPECIES: Flp family type IVb pilin [Vibrio]MCC4781293.1 Flp family type IVb pilin [Vibrio lentus]PMG57680.1 pilin [Vibrio splendidus]PMH61255.1 pilin [Vibrio lentus]PMJ06458.1 pilin [Vibrio lentus]PTO53076.1 Flp family type IVb pilin [Vibrio splendidus]
MFNKKKQRGAAAIEYAILAAAMSVVLLSFVGGENGELTTAISDAYGTVVEKLKDAQQASE